MDRNQFILRTLSVVGGLLVVTVSAQGEQPRADQSRASPEPFSATRVAGVRTLLPESRIVAVEDAGPEVVIYNDESPRAGSTATAAAQNHVYKNDYDSGYAVFLNYYPNTGALFPGTMMADEVILGNGFHPATNVLTGYEIKIFRSSLDPTDGITLATYHVELWDGDPLNAIDTTGDGFKGMPIATATFSGVPGPIVAILHADIPKTTVNRQRLWLVLYAEDTCRTGWRISSKIPQIGDIFRGANDVAAFQSDYDGQFNGLGHCCNSGALPFDEPCDVINDPCTGDTTGRGFCTDMDAESAGLFFFGGPCSGGIDDFCASFVASVFSQTNFTITLQPRMSDGGHEVIENEVTLEEGGAHVWLDILFKGWGSMVQPGFVTDIKTWRAKLDPSGYYSGLQGMLTPWNPPCTDVSDCAALQLGGGCNDPAYPPGGCSPGFQDWSLDPTCPTASGNGCLQLHRPAVSVGTRAYVYGSTASAHDPATDDGLAHYAGTVVLEVSPGAKGTFTIPFDVVSTWMKNYYHNLLPMIGHVPALITIETGACSDLGASYPFICLGDDFTRNECEALGPGHCFGPGYTCADPPGCSEDAHCDDGNACTRDICPPDGCYCDHEPIDCDDGLTCTIDSDCDPDAPVSPPQNGCSYTPLDCVDSDLCTVDSCVEPGGCAFPPKDCSDGNPCTEDSCDPATGDCLHDDVPGCCNTGDQCPPNHNCVNNACTTIVIPTVSQWGLTAMTLLLLAGAKVHFGYRRARTLSGSGHHTL